MPSDKAFDPYHKWLGISADQQPPNHYRLLGINIFESDSDVIQAAADQRMAHVRTFQAGQHSAFSQRLLNEIAAVKVCLLNAKKKAAYDADLSSRVTRAMPVGRPVVTGAVNSRHTSKNSLVTNGPIGDPPRTPFDDILHADLPFHCPKPQKRAIPYPAIGVVVSIVIVAIAAVAVVSGNRQASDEIEGAPSSLVANRQVPATAEHASITHDRLPFLKSNPISVEQPKANQEHDMPIIAGTEILTEEAPSVDDSAVTPRETQLVALKPKQDDQQSPEADTAEEASQPEKSRLSVPDKAARTSAIETVHETFKDEYELAKTPVQMVELANMLLKQAKETTNDPASQYALLQEAGKTAATAGELQLALQVCDEMARYFDVDPLALKIKTLEAAERLAKSSPQRSAVLEQSISVMEEAIWADSFPGARTLGGLALSIAQAIKDANAIKTLDSRLKEIDEIAADYDAVKKAIQIVKATPGDAAASLTVGKFECFAKGNWQKGLPLLAASNDAQLKMLALSELESPASAEERFKIGDGWWSIGTKESEGAKKQAMLHSYEFYSQSLSELSGLPRTKIERRIRQVEDDYLGWIDALKLVDVNKDKMSGKWIRRGKDVAVARGRPPQSACCVPVRPGENYKLRLVFTRSAGSDPGLVLPIGPTAVQMVVSGWNEQAAGLQMVDGKEGLDNVTTIRPAKLKNNHKYVVECTINVRNGVANIDSTLDGQDFIKFRGEVARLQAIGWWEVPNPKQIALTAWEADIVFHEMKICRLPGSDRNRAMAESSISGKEEVRASEGKSANWTEAILQIDTNQNTVKGRWESRGNKLSTVGNEEDNYIKVANDPGDSYEVEVIFLRKAGDDSISLMLPIGSTDCQMAVSAFNGKVAGIESIQGRGIDKNETTRRPSPVANGKKHVLNCTVAVSGEKAVIVGRLDGNEITRYEGPVAAISPPAWWWAKGKKTLAVGTHLSSVEFTSIKYRRLSQ